MHSECCQCYPLLCGPHVIKPCRVAALKQVHSQTDPGKMLFIAIVVGSTDATLFLNESDAAPLLEFWGIRICDIGGINLMAPEAQKRYNKKMQAVRRARRAKDNLRKVGTKGDEPWRE